LGALPLIADAFPAGQLSFDKGRAITRVAVVEDEAWAVAAWMCAASSAISVGELGAACPRGLQGRAIQRAFGLRFASLNCQSAPTPI
jgi:hypothetical protein